MTHPLVDPAREIADAVLFPAALEADRTGGGGPSTLRSSVAQLLARDAVFTPVAVSRPELKRSLVERFSRQRS